MSTDKFDNIFKDRLKDFGGVPNKDVWNKIEKKIDTPKKKHLMPLIALGGVAVLAAIGSIIAISYQPENNLEVNNSNKSAKETFVSKTDSKKKKNNKHTDKGANNEGKESETTESNTATKEVRNAPVYEKIVKHKDIGETNNSLDSEELKEDEKEKEVKRDPNYFYAGDVITIETPIINKASDEDADTVIIKEQLPAFVDISSIKITDNPSAKFKYSVNEETNTITWTIYNLPCRLTDANNYSTKARFEINILSKVEKGEFLATTTYEFKYPTFNKVEKLIITDY